MAIRSFVWRIDSGQIALEELQSSGDADLSARVDAAINEAQKCISPDDQECRARAGELLRPIFFEFGIGNLDGPTDEILTNPDDVTMNLSPEDSTIEAQYADERLTVTIEVHFPLEVNAGVSDERVTEWIENSGGAYAGFASGGWSYDGDQGQELWIVEA